MIVLEVEIEKYCNLYKIKRRKFEKLLMLNIIELVLYIYI